MGILAIAVLLLVIMPVLLYLVGWGVTRFTRKPSGWLSLPNAAKGSSGRPAGQPPARIEP